LNKLSERETQYLIKQSQSGDMKARNKLILSNLRLVYHFAHRYRNLEFKDKVSVGVLGLIRAIKKYKKQRNIKFSTYASIWISSSIRRYVYQEPPKHQPIDVFTLITKPDRKSIDLKLILDKIKGKERDIIKKHLSGWTLKRIGEKYHCSGEWIRQKEKAALCKIRRLLRVLF